MKYVLLVFLAFSLNGKDLKEDIDDWLAGRKIQILKTTVKDLYTRKPINIRFGVAVNLNTISRQKIAIQILKNG